MNKKERKRLNVRRCGQYCRWQGASQTNSVHVQPLYDVVTGA